MKQTPAAPRHSLPSLAPKLAVILAVSLSVGACKWPLSDPAGRYSDEAGDNKQNSRSSLSRERIEQAEWSPPPATAKTNAAPAGGDSAPAAPDPALIRAQILLDRARFSPGAIDGLLGSNLRQAIRAYQMAHGLPADGELDAQVLQRLTAEDHAPVTMTYKITAQDVAGPYMGRVPTRLEEQAEAPYMGYANVVEALAERFHVTEDLLRAMNPDARFDRAGEELAVPALSRAPLPADVARIDIDKSEGSARAYDSNGMLLAYYPASIGSPDNPTPSGVLKVNGVARNPDYTYDPQKLSYGSATRRMVVKPGPNNPVGLIWIDLDRPSYGIHGTPDPAAVGKSASHGCVRLTNWDVIELAQRVKPGVTVRFV